MSQEQNKIEELKKIFSSLSLEDKAVFANWCGEEMERLTSQFLGKKMQEVSDKTNKVLSEGFDKIMKAGSKIFNETNDAFKSSKKDSDGPSFFD